MRVRILNKTFWITLVPALALLLQTFLAVFNIRLELGETIDKLLVFINALFAVFVIVGVVNDPTTSGVSDSTRAMTTTVRIINKITRQLQSWLPFFIEEV